VKRDTLVIPSKDDLVSLFLAQSSRQPDSGYSCSQVSANVATDAFVSGSFNSLVSTNR
jgi:hypothetical protein